MLGPNSSSDDTLPFLGRTWGVQNELYLGYEPSLLFVLLGFTPLGCLFPRRSNSV